MVKKVGFCELVVSNFTFVLYSLISLSVICIFTLTTLNIWSQRTLIQENRSYFRFETVESISG